MSVFRHVFLQHHNLFILAGAAGLSLALYSPVPILVALVVEGIWLMVAPSIPAFRRWLDGREAAPETIPADGSATIPAAPLDPGQVWRGQALELIAADVLELAATRGAGLDLLAHIRARLHGLLAAFERMATLRQRLWRFLAVEKDGTVNPSQRLEQHEPLENTRRALEVRMTTLEKGFADLRAALADGGSRWELMANLAELEMRAGVVAALESRVGGAAAVGTEMSLAARVAGQNRM